MGCICSKECSEKDKVDELESEKELDKSSVQLVAPAPSKREEVESQLGGGSGSVRPISKSSSRANAGSVHAPLDDEEKELVNIGSIKGHHQRRATLDLGASSGPSQVPKIHRMSHGAEGEQIAGWPSWLTSVAGDAIKGLVPRRADSFEKLDKIGQGTYSNVYRARDLETGKIVALKKVRFINMDPESVRFMAREIYILRKLDHPNVMRLGGIVTSRMSGSLYLVFEYMEHDLAGLAAKPGVKFTEAQIKCYMQQLLRGLEHCHSRGILHRDIKGSNLLIGNDGVLKIGDFGLATLFDPNKNQPLTSRVVTLWYRPPELLLGATEYGPAIDLWSTGCILAELLAGKPIMPGRTEVEQMHKIFKLCGSPCEEYWQRTKFPLTTTFKPQHSYKRRVLETFKDFPSSALALVDKLLSVVPEDRGSAASALRHKFFTSDPLPCDPSSLPKYPPSKEFDAKLRDEEARRQKTETVKGRGPVSVTRGTRDPKVLSTLEFNAKGESKPKMSSHKYNPHEDGGSGFPIEPPRGAAQNGYSHSTSMIHPAIVGLGSSRRNGELRSQRSHMPHAVADLSNSSVRKDKGMTSKESGMGFVPKKNRIHYSGPLVPPGGNIEDMLKEHEKLIQEAFRKARVDKTRINGEL